MHSHALAPSARLARSLSLCFLRPAVLIRSFTTRLPSFSMRSLTAADDIPDLALRRRESLESASPPLSR